ncbi:MAG: hypothetical protein ACJAWL_002382 [Motiliproteus sp.]|jgi:hypothetical protein
MNFSKSMSIKHTLLDVARYCYYSFFNDRHKFNMARYHSCELRKPWLIMRTELKALKKYWGCIPMQYYTHDFYRADCKLTLDEMKSYIPGYYFYNIIYNNFDDVKKAKGALENKILSYFVFKGMGYQSSHVIAFKKDDFIFSAVGQFIDNDTFLKVITALNCPKIFIKPVEGKGGVGILIAKKNDQQFFVGNELLTLKFLRDLKGDFLIEQKVEQVDYLNAVYPHSVNTLRAVTKRNFSGEVQLIAVTLRMGTSGREVDNSHLGGLLIGIDLKTGQPLRNHAGYEYGAEMVFNHPDTNYCFASLKIKNWLDIKNSIVGYGEQMLLQNLIGWDIAITERGPLVIEANTMFGLDHSQSGVGGMRDLFDK